MTLLHRFSSLVQVAKPLMLIIWPFLAIVLVLLWLSIESMNTLIAVRSFAEGEGLWSKAQKSAVLNLVLYSRSRSDSDFRNYIEAISVPLGDKMARIELDSPEPDYAIVWQGLIQGRTHPEDIPYVITLFRRFQRVSFMADVIRLWEEGDRLMDELRDAAEELHTSITNKSTDDEILAIEKRILEVDKRLTPLADQFTKRLGDAARTTQFLLMVLNFGAAGVLLPLGAVMSLKTVKRRDDAEQALGRSEERFQLAVSGSNDGLWDWNLLTGEIYYSPRFSQLLGFTEGELEPNISAIVSRLHQDDKEATAKALDDHLKGGAPFDIEMRLLTLDIEYRWFRARGRSVRDSAGSPVRMAGAITDINESKLQSIELAKEKERAQVTLASIADAVVTTDAAGVIEYLNPLAQVLLGKTQSAACGQHIRNILHILDENSRQPAPNPVDSALREGRAVEVASTMLLSRPDRTEVPITLSAAPIRGHDGNISGVVLVLHDVSNERQYAAQLSYQASHDSLTGLFNRSQFEQKVRSALSTASPDQQHAVLYLDLDQFKVVNDTCGHSFGDYVIRKISEHLSGKMREGNTLARLGGDEFGILLERCPADRAMHLADEIRKTVIDVPFVWENHSFTVGASIGLVTFENDRLSLADVLGAADAACYLAKDKGRNRVQVYQSNDKEVAVRHNEMDWVLRLRKTIDDNRFVLYSQDIVALDESLCSDAHCELLIRMIDERGELVPPGIFIPSAERYDLITAIDRWTIQTAFSEIGRQPTGIAGRQTIYSINLSGASIGDESFLVFVQDLLATSNVRPQCICFEITETAAIANLEKATRFIDHLKALGCLFSLDDFGAGMSSFAYLKHLPVDFLKIDGGFVKDMVDKPIDRAMVEAINNLGHLMNIQTIAEFAENERTVVMLRELGVDFAQGFGISKPKLFAPKLRVALAS